MTDNSLPMSQGAPGQQLDHAALMAHHMPSAHMPPPSLPMLNTNPDLSGDDEGSIMSAGGTITRAAPEPNKRALYVGGLDPRVTEEVLRQIFETAGHVITVKIIPDKNVSHEISSSKSIL